MHEVAEKAGGLVETSVDPRGENRATVVAVNKNSEVKIGDELIIQRFAGEDFKDDSGETFRFLPEDQVLATLDT